MVVVKDLDLGLGVSNSGGLLIIFNPLCRFPPFGSEILDECGGDGFCRVLLRVFASSCFDLDLLCFKVLVVRVRRSGALRLVRGFLLVRRLYF